MEINLEQFIHLYDEVCMSATLLQTTTTEWVFPEVTLLGQTLSILTDEW